MTIPEQVTKLYVNGDRFIGFGCFCPDLENGLGCLNANKERTDCQACLKRVKLNGPRLQTLATLVVEGNSRQICSALNQALMIVQGL